MQPESAPGAASLERNERIMDQMIEQSVINTRHILRDMPELAGQETATRAAIRNFLRNTSLEVVDRGTWLYAKHWEGAAKTVVIRADHDAVPTPQGPRHLCGHDGHTAALLGLALLLEGRTLGKNVILLFQPAEETGEGAEVCCGLFALEGLNRENACVLGCHNIPGEPLGMALFRRGTFACASCGLEISLTGTPTHAAYPENGRNPSAALARLALELPALAARIEAEFGCMALATVVGLRAGGPSFGVAASEGELWVTLRAAGNAAFEALNAWADEAAKAAAAAEGLDCQLRRMDVFPATENDEALQDALEGAFRAAGVPCRYLEKPFRWSEDFGHYGRFVPACFFGVGAGENAAPLHTEAYAYPDALALPTAELFMTFLQ